MEEVCSRAHWPEEWQHGMIKTKNTMGVMTNELAPASVAFVEAAKEPGAHVLDLGAAYGVATYPALEAGASVTACDLSEAHLAILTQGVPQSLQGKLKTQVGRFPGDYDFESNHFSAIHISMMLHFLGHDDLMEGLKRCYEWLKPGGKMYIVVVTPYVANLSALAPRFEENLASKKEWPGEFYMDNEKDVSMGWADSLPPFIHVFDKNTLRDIFIKAGFTVNESRYFTFSYIDSSYKTGGKEFVSLIATK